MVKPLWKTVRQWCTPVIPATWEVEIGRITVQGPLRQKVRNTTSPPIKKEKRKGMKWCCATVGIILENC
jgi:hypothetical protein